MDKADLHRLATAYIEYCRAKTEKEKDALWAKGMSDIDRVLYEDPENTWQIINKVHSLTDDPQILAVLSAGLLENLLSQFPYQSINWVEDEARKDPRFKNLLLGVWQNLMPDEIWERVLKARS